MLVSKKLYFKPIVRRDRNITYETIDGGPFLIEDHDTDMRSYGYNWQDALRQHEIGFMNVKRFVD